MKFKLAFEGHAQLQNFPGSESPFMLFLIQFLLSQKHFDKPQSLLNTVARITDQRTEKSKQT